MVEAATGSIGSLTIDGSIDTNNIERGFSRIKSSFAGVEGFAKGTEASFERMKMVSKDLATGLTRLGMVGAGAMVALAKSAPAVAPAMAQISVAMMKLKFAAGEALAPAFERVAGWLDKFAVWTGEHPKLFSGLVVSMTALAGLKFAGLTGILGLLANPVVLTAIGALTGLAVLGESAIAKPSAEYNKAVEPAINTISELSERGNISKGQQMGWNFLFNISDIFERLINTVKGLGPPMPTREKEQNRKMDLLSMIDSPWS